jgi:hypothetical protein
MPLKVHVVHARDFVRMTPEGKFDLHTSQQLLAKVVAAGASPAEHEILIDTRRALGELSHTDLWYLAVDLSQQPHAYREKIAIVVDAERQFDNAKFFELCATNRALKVRAVETMDQAIEWLFPSTEVELEDQTGP